MEITQGEESKAWSCAWVIDKKLVAALMKQQLDSWISTPDLLESWNSATFLLEKKYPAFFMGAAGIQDFRENKKERAGIKDSRERITCLKSILILTMMHTWNPGFQTPLKENKNKSPGILETRFYQPLFLKKTTQPFHK